MLPILRHAPKLGGLCLVLVLAVAMGAVGCAEQSGKEHGAERAPDIIFISLDTLRRDHVGLYRPPDEPSPTPHLDRLGTSAVVFDDAYATVPFTLPSHLSMFTGLYPDVHGVDAKDESLNTEIPTLPELLEAGGYTTLGLATNIWMKGEFGFARGFDHYERVKYGLTYSDRVNQRALELVDELDADEPLFLFLHYLDAHSDWAVNSENLLPYYAPPELLQELGIDQKDPRFCVGERCASDFLITASREGLELEEERLEMLRALYRKGVEYLDADLGALFAGLEARGRWNDAWVVVTSDHGEEFREHGDLLHHQPYAENLAVPLIVKLPGSKFGGSRRRGLAESVDLLPTLLEAAGLPRPEILQGESLLRLIENDRPVRPHALGRNKHRRLLYAFRSQELSLVHDFETGVSELYDRVADPEERHDLAAERPEDVAALLAQLERAIEGNKLMAEVLARDPSAGEEILTEEEKEKLRALGYLQ